MRRATRSLITLLVVLSLSAMAFAADPNVGTFKLNESKSKIPKGAGKNTSVTYTEEGDQYKCVTEGDDGKGNSQHTEWTGKFDGKDYPVTGDSRSDMRSVKKTAEGHYAIVNKKDGKPTLTGTVAFSKDNKTRTLTTQGTDDKGKKWTATYVACRKPAQPDSRLSGHRERAWFIESFSACVSSYVEEPGSTAIMVLRLKQEWFFPHVPAFSKSRTCL